MNPHGGRSLWEINRGSVLAKYYQGSGKTNHTGVWFCIQSFERICGYFAGKGPVSLVTGPTFTRACNNTCVFAMGKSLTQSPAPTLEVCQHVVV